MLTLKIFSYNILEDRLSNPDFFINSKNEHLDKYNRIKKLIPIINTELNNSKYYNIFCIQEVGIDVQASELYKIFFQYNYDVIFVGDVFIAYPNTFELISCNMGNISKLLKIINNNFSDKQIQLINSKYKYFIMLHLKEKLTNIEFTIANTHLIAMNHELKILQLILLLTTLNKYKNVIFVGDLNIESTNNVLNLITDGVLNNEFGEYKLQKKYKSAYNISKNFITTHTSNRITPIYTEMLDYIFVSPHIKVLDCKKLYEKNQFKNNNNYWPSDDEPSDHTLIWAIIEI